MYGKLVPTSATSASVMQAAEFEQMRCNNKTRFILAVVADKLKISNRKRADIEEQLVGDGYDKMPNRAAAMVTTNCLQHKKIKICKMCC